MLLCVNRSLTVVCCVAYHPQNEALLQWFEFESPSSAIDGAYSYPNESVLTALSPIERPCCPAQ